MQKADAVFEGGGVKGIALVGAMQAFEEAEFEWQNVAGTSAGAITAALVAVGYTAAEVKEIMDTRVEFRRFMDVAGIGKLPIVGPWLSLIFKNGMYEGDYFLKLMRQLLSEKVGHERVTFRDLIIPREAGDSDEDYENLYKYKLRLIASDLSGNDMLVLPHDIRRLGVEPEDLEVALAVRMSMGIPYFFKPVKFGVSRPKHWIVDGGMLSNFPIWLFDSTSDRPPDWPTIGFLLWEPGSLQPRNQRIGGLISMTKAMSQTLAGAIDRKALDEADLSRVVKIPTKHYSATDFDLTDEDRAWLYNSGYQAGQNFLASWSFGNYVDQRMRRTRQANP